MMPSSEKADRQNEEVSVGLVDQLKMANYEKQINKPENEIMGMTVTKKQRGEPLVPKKKKKNRRNMKSEKDMTLGELHTEWHLNKRQIKVAQKLLNNENATIKNKGVSEMEISQVHQYLEDMRVHLLADIQAPIYAAKRAVSSVIFRDDFSRFKNPIAQEISKEGQLELAKNIFFDESRLNYQYFEKHMKKEFAQENLHFFNAVLFLECVERNPMMYLATFQEIYERFVAIGSPEQINISHGVRSKLTEVYVRNCVENRWQRW